MIKHNKKLVSTILAFVMLIGMGGTLAACGASAPMENNKYAGAGMAINSAASDSFFDFDMMESESIAMAPSKAPTAPQSLQPTPKENGEVTESYLNSQKLIYTCNINIESLQFTETQSKIQELINQYGGFIESNHMYDNAYGWYYSSYEKTSGTLTQELTVRIPSEHYDAFVNGVSAVGKVQRKTENVQNITTQYNDTATTIRSLKTQEDRLLEMMEACNTIDEMITVERRLSEVQTQLERYQTQLNAYDADIQFSTITIVLTEVKEYSPTYEEKNFFQRLAEHFDTTIEDFAAFMEGALFAIIYLFPYALIIAAIVIFICHMISKKKAKKMAPPVEADAVKIISNDNSNKQKDISVQTEVGSKKNNKK